MHIFSFLREMLVMYVRGRTTLFVSGRGLHNLRRHYRLSMSDCGDWGSSDDTGRTNLQTTSVLNKAIKKQVNRSLNSPNAFQQLPISSKSNSETFLKVAASVAQTYVDELSPLIPLFYLRLWPNTWPFWIRILIIRLWVSKNHLFLSVMIVWTCLWLPDPCILYLSLYSLNRKDCMP